MRTNFSPTLEAARRLAVRGAATKASTDSTPPMDATRWCEWPRRAPTAPRSGIWQALREIQARHA